MPTYEYACRSCGEHLEVVQAFTDPARTECPKCGGSLRKVFGNVGISFKGDGFYKTDSRKTASASSRSERTADKAESGSKAATDNGSTGEASPAKPSEKSGGSSDSSGGTDSPKSTAKSKSKSTTPSPSAT